MKRAVILGLVLWAWVGSADTIWPGAGVTVTPSKHAQVTETADGVVVKVGDCAPNVWPAVYFNFDKPRDLSKCESLFVTLTNCTDSALRLSVKVKGITQQGQLPEGGLNVPARGSRVKELRLFAESWAFDKAHGLVGLKRQPSVGGSSSYSLEKVTAISVYLPNGKSNVSFGVKSVTVTPGEGSSNKFTLLKVDSFFPWVDEFGQANFAEFPDKIHSKEELLAHKLVEEKELAAKPCGIPGSDRFGGWADGPQLAATGYFRTQKLNGKWWFVDPEGHLFISHGLNCGWELSPTGITGREKYFEKLPPKEGPTKQFWSYHKKPSSKNWYSNPINAPFWAFSPAKYNLWLKFGEGWQTKNDENMARRMRAWGINDTTGTRPGVRTAAAHVPYITAIGPRARPIAGTKGYWGQLSDFFAPEFAESCRRLAEAARESGTNQWCVGWTANNEQTWYGDGLALTRAVFASPDDQPAKIALSKILADRGKTYTTATDDDLRALAVALAEKYYSTVRAAIKAVAPNHLYLGDRNDKLNPEVFLAASRHCDVITINRYEYRPEAELPPGSVDKPFLVTEFHFGCYDTGYFYASLIPVKDQKTRAQCYLDYQRAVIDSPNYVGAHWFCWRDLPITGEAGIGANAQCGLVSITDIPYTELIGAVKTIAGEMYSRRYGKPVAKAVLVPAPRKMTKGEGAYEVKAKEVTPALATFTKDAALPTEGYALSITAKGIAVKSSDEAGAFYALQTLKQLATPIDKNLLAFPCVEIEDAPAYRYRGLMIDEARHFLGKEVVKKELDLMARHKLNVFHWHLTDDQGWRLEIKRHPELVEYGSVRPESVIFGGRPWWVKRGFDGIRYKTNNEKYGPFFYTQEDVKEILAYAAERHITVIPEIELPGHERALLAARPDLGCRGEKLARTPRVLWSIEEDVLCAGNDDMIRYLEEIFDEVCALFPSQIIHIGGDECPKSRWKECPKCQARMKALGIKEERGLQTWLTTHFAEYLAKKGRRALGWDEVLYGDAPKSVIGMSWRMSAKGGSGGDYVSPAEALARGYDMVMTPSRKCYYSYPQDLAEDPYPYYSSGSGITLESAYSFDPAEGIPEEARAHILGGQASVWGESIFNVFDFEWKAWPRTCAMAEILWTAPAPRDFDDFKSRMKAYRPRLIADHVNCAPLE